MQEKFKRVFSLDYRSLALLRIGLAIILITDLLGRLLDLKAFYTDSGVLPRSVLFDTFGGDYFWSIHNISGIWQVELIIFIIAIIVAMSLLVGYRTTLATVISWILLVSIQNRNPLIIHAGDTVLRLTIFWAMFLPLGKYMSIDSLKISSNLNKKTMINGASFAYVLSIVSFYIFSALMKTGLPWHDGTAVYYALQIDQMSTRFGHFVLNFPNILSFITYGVLCVELYISLLILSPWKTAILRIVCITIFVIMQIGFGSGLHLGLFPFISIIILFGLLPSLFWDSYVQKFKIWINKNNKYNITIYYDYNCGFCYRAVHILARLILLPENIKIIASDENREIGNEMVQINSWIVINPDGKHLYKTQAFIEILKSSPIFWPLSYIFNIRFIKILGDYIYDKIAQKRLLICVPQDTKIEKNNIFKKVSSVIVVLLFLYTIAWNIETLGDGRKIIPEGARIIAYTTRLDQRWGMFAPYPRTEDGWYVVPGKLVNGTDVNLFTNENSVSYEKPKDVSAMYTSTRWRTYLMNLWLRYYSNYRPSYSRYLCREWNNKHQGDMKLKSLQIIFMLEITKPNYEKVGVNKVVLQEYNCF